MSESMNLKAVIDFMVGKRGDKDAEKGLKGIGDQAQKTKKKLKETGGAAENLGKKLVQFLGAAVIFRLVSSSVVEFAKYKRVLNSVEDQLDRMGLAHEGAMGRIETFLESVESVTGTLRQETAPVFQKFLGILGDVDAAMAATSLATDLAARGLGDFKGSAEALSMVILGEATEAMKKFGVEQTVANEAGLNNVEVLKELIEKNRGYASTVQDAQSKLEKQQSTWNDIKQTIGEGVAPALGMINTIMGGVVKSIQSGGTVLGAFIGFAMEAFPRLGKTIAAVFDLKKLATEGFDAYRLATREGAEGIRNLWTNTQIAMGEDITAIWAETGEKSAVSFEEGYEKAVEKAGVKRAERLKAQADREIEQKRKDAEAIVALEESFLQRRMAEEIRAAEALSEEKLRIELDLLDRQFRAAIALARAKNANVEELEAAHQLARQNLIGETEQAREDRDADALEEIERKEADSFRTQLEAIEKMNAARQTAQDDRIAGASEMVGALGGLMGGMFGAAKATAIAQAIINTYEGASKALAQGGFFGAAMAGLVIAMGLSHVAAIRSSEPGAAPAGAGFDDPENDRLARIGGRNWARDALRHIGTGFHAELAAPTGGIPISPSPGPGAEMGRGETIINLTVNGLYGGRVGLRGLSRELRRVTQQERSREIG